MTDKEKQDYKQVQARLLAKHLIESKNRRKENRQGQIEEMANCKPCYKGFGRCPLKDRENCSDYTRAVNLYNAGYRKIPEGSVVLSIEEVEEFRKDSAEVKFLKNKIIEQTRKETAREFAEKLKAELHGWGNVVLEKDVDDIAKQFGVEVEE